jgi:riboflavin kinase/FMN adenylyltransferase
MARSVTVGHDFRFGKDRAGNIETLKQLGKEASVPVNVVEPISNRDERVSSTRIRTLLRDGDLEAANELLGRPYFVSGNVTSGDNRGEGLGFPTANIATAHDKALPKNGVYVTRATWQKQFFSAVCNVGVRPTFNEGESERRLEVHFLDFSNQIYSEWVKVEFLERIRDEKKFASREELVKQIQSDVASCKMLASSSMRVGAVLIN